MEHPKEQTRFIDEMKRPPRELSPAAFWFWYGELKPDKLVAQLSDMAAHGVYNAFMHARAYLTTPYLGEDWWRCVEAVIKRAAEEGAYAWLYDEYAWPSGTAGNVFPDNPFQEQSRVLACGERFAAKRLRVARDDNGEVAGLVKESVPGLVDYMSKAAMRRFIDVTHEEYKKRVGGEFGKSVPGIFFDEIYMTGELPWTDGFEQEFLARKGYDITPKLILLATDCDGSAKVREDYYEVVSQLYEEAFFKQIADWCAQNSLMLTGHTEEELAMHPMRQGDYFRTMRRLQIPGADCHSYRYSYPRRIRLVEPKYAVSTARLGSKPRAMSESMGGAGWACTIEEYKRGINAMCAAGINMHVLHGFSYEISTQGEQGDWPASFFFQNPYWPHFKAFADYITRADLFNARGRARVEVALYYPIRDIWRNTVAGRPNAVAREISRDFEAALNALMARQIDVDFIDEGGILSSRIELGQSSANGTGPEPARLITGEERFSVILVHEKCEFTPEIEAKLAGVKVARFNGTLPDTLPKSVFISDETDFLSCRREIDGSDAYFITNQRPETRSVIIRLESSGDAARRGCLAMLCLDDGSVTGVRATWRDGFTEFEYAFEPDEGAVFLPGVSAPLPYERAGETALSNEWRFMPGTGSTMELPIALIDGELARVVDSDTGVACVERHVGDWQGKWIVRRPSWVDDSSKPEQYFARAFILDSAPKSARLCVCAVGEYEVFVNGHSVASGEGFEAPSCSDVTKYLVVGKNLITANVRNKTPMTGANNLWKCRLDPNELIGLLLELHVDDTVIASDSEFIVSDKPPAPVPPENAPYIDARASKTFSDGAKSGEWIHAWERGKPPLQPFGEIPLFGQGTRYPRKVEYVFELPRGFKKVACIKARGNYDMKCENGQLRICLTATSGADGLLAPPVIELDETVVRPGDWRKLGLPYYSGACDYVQSFDFKRREGSVYRLEVSDARFYVNATLNGANVGARLCPPYSFDITEALRDGDNELKLSIANTAANERMTMLCDAGRALGWNRYWNHDNILRDARNLKSGLMGDVKIVEYRR